MSSHNVTGIPFLLLDSNIIVLLKQWTLISCEIYLLVVFHWNYTHRFLTSIFSSNLVLKFIRRMNSCTWLPLVEQKFLCASFLMLLFERFRK